MTMLLSALGFAFLSIYYRFPFALALFLGGGWSVLNLLALTFMVQQLLRPTPIDWPTAAAAIFVKLPLLYGAGFLLANWDYLPKLGLLTGFSLVFAVVVLKGLGRLILQLDERDVSFNPTETKRA